MEQVHITRLLFGRRLVLFDQFFPQDVLADIDQIIETNQWHSWDQANRQSIDQQLGRTNAYLELVVPNLIMEWTGRKPRLLRWNLWLDHPGLHYRPHGDLGLFRQHEQHLQVYLGMESAPGTNFHPVLLPHKTFAQAEYKRNGGYFLDTAQTVAHSVDPVPNNTQRLSLVARYADKYP